MNKKFTAPEVDVEHFVKQFENDSRDVYVKRQDIVRAVGLRPGEAVADIGAGTGLFTFLFAEQVGPKRHRLRRRHRPGVRQVHRRARPSSRDTSGRQDRAEHARTPPSCRPARSTLPSSATRTTTSSTRRRCWPRSTAPCVRAGG